MRLHVHLKWDVGCDDSKQTETWNQTPKFVALLRSNVELKVRSSSLTHIKNSSATSNRSGRGFELLIFHILQEEKKNVLVYLELFFHLHCSELVWISSPFGGNLLTSGERLLSNLLRCTDLMFIGVSRLGVEIPENLKKKTWRYWCFQASKPERPYSGGLWVVSILGFSWYLYQCLGGQRGSKRSV